MTADLKTALGIPQDVPDAFAQLCAHVHALRMENKRLEHELEECQRRGIALKRRAEGWGK